ncbi:MAG: hypothetical protein ACYC1D_03565 [Acidimicrobiales bacterium]
MSTVQRLRASIMRRLAVLSALMLALASCGAGGPVTLAPTNSTLPAASSTTTLAPLSTTAPTTAIPATPATPGTSGLRASILGSPLPSPAALAPFGSPALAGEGTWSPAGRPVGGGPAVYETTLVPPGGTQPAGIAWMDTRLLSARLYSGSKSPGGGPYRYTAPILPAQAASLVAAFNGGFVMNVAGGGYYTEGRIVDPLVGGAASLVVYSDGSVNVGAWSSDVAMTPSVVSVRQNLVPLVAGGQPTPEAASPNWQAWGATCGATSCSASVPGIEHQWRSGVGVTADGALVYATGPGLAPLQLAQLLVRAGVVRGMQLDINPDWTVFVTYNPPTPGGLAAPSNGSKLVSSTVQGPSTFFQAWWARDFITMSARVTSSG